MSEFEQKKKLFEEAKWGSYIILPLRVKNDGKSDKSRQEIIESTLNKQLNDGAENSFFAEEIDTSDLSDILTGRCEKEGDFVDQYGIKCELSRLYFVKEDGKKEEYIEAKDIHLFYFSESKLAFLAILLVNQNLTIDNFYEFVNPGYMMDYNKVEQLRRVFLHDIQTKIIDDILKDFNFEIYVTNPETNALKESYWLNAAIVRTRFTELTTLNRLTYNAHRFIPIETDFEDSSEKDIGYVSGAKDVKQHDYGWGCCVSSQSISYVYGDKPKIKENPVSGPITLKEIQERSRCDLLLTVIALFQKYICIELNNSIYEKIKEDEHKEENIHEIKSRVLKMRAYETYTPSQISRWNNVCEIYSQLLEINGVNDYMNDIQDKVNLLDEELERVSIEREKKSSERENKIMNIIALFGALSIIASVLTIIDFIKGSPIDMGIASASVTVVVVSVIVAILWKKK